jgi:hypothetical protein
MRSLRYVIIVLFCLNGLSQEQEPVSLVAHQDFGLSLKGAWTIKISGSELTIEKPGKNPARRRLSEKELNQLRQALKMSNWDTLQDRYGCSGVCDDFPTCSLEVKTSDITKRVILYQTEKPLLAESVEARRFFSVWRVIKVLSKLQDVRDACQ